MFDGCLLPLVFPCLLFWGLDAGTAGGAELEVVIPERVALEKIHLLPPALRGDRGGPRRRRALPRPRTPAEALLLRLPAAGTELYLHLRRDLRFLARGFVVEQRQGAARRAPSPRRPPEERLCFYTGRVLNRTDSFASLSTCAGLVGYIQIGSEHMLIQPVNTSETSFSGKEHFIRRRRSTRSGHPLKSHTPDEHCKVVAGVTVPGCSVSFVPLLPHYLTNIPASASWRDCSTNTNMEAVGQGFYAVFY